LSDTHLSVPIISSDLWLDRGAFEEVRDLVGRMMTRIEQDERPLPFPPREKLQGIFVTAKGGDPKPREIRGAAFLNGTPIIVLDPFPCFDEEVGPLKADLEGFRSTMLGLLAHEASHIRQWVVARDEAAHSAASMASRKAQATKDYDDYVTYLATPLELAAHSTQLAAEVWAAEADGLSQPDFESAAARTGLWTHMTDHPVSRPACLKSGAEAFGRVGKALLANSWWAYQRLTAQDAAAS